MMQKSLKYALLLICGVAALATVSASADEKKDGKPALSGTWAKKEGELKIEFADKNVMKIAPHGDPAVITIVCEYKVEKKGQVKAEVKEFEGKEEAKKQIQNIIPVGYTFTFKWRVKADTAKLEELMGANSETLKTHLEGDFEKK